MFSQQTTPKTISNKLKNYCLKVSSELPCFVDVEPDAEGMARQCYLNCARYVRKNPGASIVFGWVVWESSIILELEAHSVVRLEDGRLIDVTPPVDGERKILFLPDRAAAPRFDFNGSSGIGFWVTSFHNLIFPTTQKSQRQVLSRDESSDPAENAADFAEKYPGLTIGKDTFENTATNDTIWRVDRYVPQIVGPKVGRNEPCPCGSGKKYKKCCCS